MALAPTAALIEEVRADVDALARRTPLVRSAWLSELHGSDVLLKCENLQRTGSFKLRGAAAAVAGLSEAGRREGVIACSAGNHGLGLAVAAREAGVRCRVVVPSGAPGVKCAAIEAQGAELVRSPHPRYDATREWMEERLDEMCGTPVSAYDDPRVIAGGGGTLALEVLEETPAIDALVVPCGGGGCVAGAALAARAARPSLRVIGVNSDASPGMWLSLRDGRPHLAVDGDPTIADGIEGGVGARAFALVRRLAEGVVLAREGTIRRAVAELARRERLVVEGAGAAGVAALLGGAVAAGPVCIVLTGGNVDADVLAGLLVRRGPAPA